MYHSSEYGCSHHSYHGHQSHRRGSFHHHSCCCGFSHGIRRFPTKEEIAQEMEEYLKQLQAEVKGVEERIAELKKEA